jgi:hypothetical protein
MYRRSTTCARYLPACTDPRRPVSSKKRSTPYCSTLPIVWLSTPAAPWFLLTRFHASREDVTSRRCGRTARGSALPGARLAAAHSWRCSCRTLSCGSSPPEWLGPVLPAILSRLPAPFRLDHRRDLSLPPRCSSRRSFARLAPTLCGTTTPSDSRCAALDFAFWLIRATSPRRGRYADGSLEFRTSPCTRAAPHTPPGPVARFGTRAMDMACAVK